MSLTKVSYSMINGAPINVLDFGADPTGVTDSSGAFNSAWSKSNPQAVFVPVATYKINSSVIGKFYSFGAVTITGTGYITSITNLVP